MWVFLDLQRDVDLSILSSNLAGHFSSETGDVFVMSISGELHLFIDIGECDIHLGSKAFHMTHLG
jgi:hypothetical protein